MSEAMSEDYLTPEDLEAIKAIVEGSAERAHGQAILDASSARQEQANAVLELLAQAWQTEADKQDKQE